MHFVIVNGPNLNLLGKREPSIYGHQSFDEFYEVLIKEFNTHQLEYYQSNSEGDIVSKIQEVGFDCDGIVLNAGALTHTSIAIADAIAAIESPVIEVHISNIYAREEFRHHSYITPHAIGILSGLGLNGYRLALQHLTLND